MAACLFKACYNVVGRIKLYPWLLSFRMLLFLLGFSMWRIDSIVSILGIYRQKCCTHVKNVNYNFLALTFHQHFCFRLQCARYNCIFFAYLSYSTLLHFAGFDYILHKHPAGQLTSDAKIPLVKR